MAIGHLLLLTVLLPIASSVPFNDVSRPAVYSQPERIVRPPIVSSNPSPFRRLRNAIIERLWSIPSTSRAKSCPTHTSSVPINYRSRYGNDVVLRFTFETEEELKALSEASDILYLDIWEISEEWVDIRISKDVVPSLLGLLPYSLRHSHTHLMHDMAQAVYDTYPVSPASTHRFGWHGTPVSPDKTDESTAPRDLFFEEYQPLSVLYPWLRLMASMYPSYVQLTSIGVSAEGRDIPALRVGARPQLPPDQEHETRKTILITSGSHAREWISVSTAAYIAWSLMTRYGDSRSPDVTKLLDHFDVVFLPTLNPDGYDYTWSNDRLWRKNRQSTPLPFCPGIDIDRAFSFGWDGNNTADNPCSEDYAGNNPLEAVEAKRLNDWAKNETENNNVTFVAYLDLHSYSQEILYPYSFSCRAEPPNLEDLEEVAIGLAKSFRLTHGHYYGVSSACEGSITADNDDGAKSVKYQMESQGGSALDFFYHDLRVKYAYQIKLRDTGSYGFLLPKQHIVPTGYEAFEAVLGLGRWMLSNHGIEKFQMIWKEADTDDKDFVLVDMPSEEQANEVVFDGSDEFDIDLRRRS